MIPLSKPKFDEEDFKVIRKVLDSGWVAGQGPMNKKLSQDFSNFIGTKGAIPVCNCTAALHLSLLALGIGKGDDVLVSDYTFPATGHAVLYTGANPIFVDVDYKSYNLSVNDMREKITKKTKTIIAVHAFGNPIKMKETLEFIKEKELNFIEDAACAVGAKYQNKSVGSFGDVGCFSFHARKILASGEGGIAVSSNESILEKISLLSNFGISSAKEREEIGKIILPSFTHLGYNYKLSDILAGLAISQLKKVLSSIKKRHEIIKIYRDIIGDGEGIYFQKVDQRNVSSYQACVIRLETQKIRDHLFSELHKVKIQAQFGTYSSVCQPIYNKNEESCPNSVKLFNTSLAIPLFDEISEEEANWVAENIVRICRKK